MTFYVEVCPIGKYTGTTSCDSNCRCLPDVSIGTCSPTEGDCYCASQLSTTISIRCMQTSVYVVLSVGNADGTTVVPVPVIQVVTVDTNSVDFKIPVAQRVFHIQFIEKLLLYQKVENLNDVSGVGGFEYAANCTLGYCSSPYLKARTTYAFVIQGTYDSLNGTQDGTGECFSGVSYVKTKAHGTVRLKKLSWL